MRSGERAARAAAYERARPEILEHVPRSARRVLDLGCATGTTGAALKQRQDVEVVGVELEPEYAREAATRLDHVLNADAETAEPDGRFDVLIAADILEHLKDPWSTLRRYAELLEPGATAIVSLPNVAPLEHLRAPRPRVLAAQARGDLRRHPPALVHAARRERPAAPGRPDAAHRRAPRLALHARLAPRRARPAAAARCPGIRTLITFQHVIAATL